MATKINSDINKIYVISVLAFTILLPLICSVVQILIEKNTALSFELLGKWFIFSAVGIRLFLAGIRQSTNPAFTAKEIFHIDTPVVFPILRELGFANICFGLIGIASLFFPQWRIVSAFGSGLYYGMAAALHLFRKPAGGNEKFALITDLFIFGFLLVYFLK